ncbi:MAG: hypothetical protein QXO44_02130 [Thermoplasmatales archaeon]
MKFFPNELEMAGSATSAAKRIKGEKWLSYRRTRPSGETQFPKQAVLFFSTSDILGQYDLQLQTCVGPLALLEVHDNDCLDSSRIGGYFVAGSTWIRIRNGQTSRESP